MSWIIFACRQLFIAFVKVGWTAVTPGSWQISGRQSLAHKALLTVSRLTLISILWAHLHSPMKNTNTMTFVLKLGITSYSYKSNAPPPGYITVTVLGYGKWRVGGMWQVWSDDCRLRATDADPKPHLPLLSGTTPGSYSPRKTGRTQVLAWVCAS